MRAVILECPYDTLSTNPIVRQIYPDLLVLKIKGYQAVYPYGVLPMDTSDYVANHILFCEETPDGYVPHMGFKSVTWNRCQTHCVPFPAYGMLDAADPKPSKAYYDYLDTVIKDAAAKGEEVGYNGSWTLSEEFRQMKDRIDFRSITNVLLTRYYQTYNIRHVVAAGTIKYKVDQMKIFMGFGYFTDQGNRLPPLNVTASYGGVDVYMMHLKDFSPEMIAQTQEPFYHAIWENRVTLAPQQDVVQPVVLKKAA